MVPMRWHQAYAMHFFSCQVAIYQADGTVAITHGGIEMGQGINTKVSMVRKFGTVRVSAK